MIQYIVIPNIKIINANAQPVWWIVGAPPVTAYVGFAHALALHLQASTHEGVAIVHHDIQLLGEQLQDKYGQMDFLPHQFRAAGLIDKDDYASSSNMSLSSQPSARCHLNVSLVIAMPEKTEFTSHQVEQFLRGARLAGGHIIKYGKINCEADTPQEYITAIGKNGWSIVERQDLMTMQACDRDRIDVLLRQTRRYSKPEKQPEEFTESTDWIVPTCLGYAGISSIKLRSKSRHELPHLYVEPLVGLVQYQSTHKAKKLHFWRYIHPQSNVFITSTQ